MLSKLEAAKSDTSWNLPVLKCWHQIQKMFDTLRAKQNYKWFGIWRANLQPETAESPLGWASLARVKNLKPDAKTQVTSHLESFLYLARR